jgi:PAS domain S-box-containing protein
MKTPEQQLTEENEILKKRLIEAEALLKRLSESVTGIEGDSPAGSKETSGKDASEFTGLIETAKHILEKTTELEERNRALEDELKTKTELEKTLLKSHDFLNEAEKMASLGTWELDIASDVIQWSDNTFQIFHADPVSFHPTFKNLLGIIHPDDREDLKNTIKHATETCSPFSTEYRIIIPGGGIRYIHPKGRVIADIKGRPVKIIGISQDITEQKNLERSLRESEKKQRDLIKYAPTAIYEIDFRDNKFISVNDAMVSMSGYSREELLASSPYDLLLDESRKEFESRILNMTAGEYPTETVEYKARAKDGHIIDGLLNVSFTLDDNRMPVGALVVAYDITERRRMEEDLRESESRFRSVLDNSRDVIYRLNVRTGRYEYVSPSCEEVIGYSAEEFMKMNLKESVSLVHPFDVDLVKVAQKECEINGRASVEYRMQHKKGEWHWFSNNMAMLQGDDSKPLYRDGTIRDITMNKQLELSLQASEKKFFTLFNESPFASSLTSFPEGTSVDVNEAFLKLFGLQREEAIGFTSAEIGIHTNKSVDHVMSLFLRDGFIRDYECIRKKKTGEPLNLLLNLDFIVIGEKKFVLTTIRDITSEKILEESLRIKNNENQVLGNILEHSSQPFGIGTPDGRIMNMNQAFERLTGYSRDELKNMRWNEELTPAEHLEAENRVLEKLIKSGIPVRYEKEYLRKDGVRVPIELLVHVIRDGDGNPQFFFSFINDITTRKLAEARQRQMISTLRAMQRMSLLVVSSLDENKFLQDVCQIIVEECNYRMVWIGFKKNNTAKSVIPVASAGMEEDYLKILRISWADAPRGKGPTGKTIRTGQPVVCKDMRTDPTFKPWRNEALKRGYLSSLVLPLILDKEVAGAINIYSDKADPFSDDEQTLFSKLASDLSFGIKSIRLNLSLKQAHEELEDKVRERTSLLERTLVNLDSERERFQEMLNLIPAYVFLRTKAHKIVFSNKIFRQYFGDPENQNCYEFLYGKKEKCEFCREPKDFLNEKPNRGESVDPGGRTFQISNIPYVDISGTPLILEMGLDITERKSMEKYVLSKILETEERDRRIFASDLHDDLGPTLSAIKLQLTMLLKEEEDEEKSKLLSSCDELLSDSVEKLRIIANNLMPNLIKSYGLVSAVNSFINKLKKNLPIRFEVQSNMEDFRLEEETELHLYRIIIELINNSIKHSKASFIQIDIHRSGEELRISYGDNGIGYNPEQALKKTSGIGLQSILNRVSIVNGKIDFKKSGGKVNVLIFIPVAEKESELY